MSAWSIGWALIGAAALLVEAAGVALNERSDAAHGPREYRTASENLRWLFATDKAGARARWRGLRRFALLAGVAWLAVHLAVEHWV